MQTRPAHSIVAAVEKQTRVIIKMAQQCEQFGYFYALHALNPELRNDKPYGYFVGGMGAFVEQWCETHGRRYIRINVFCYGEPGMHFKFRVRRTARLRQLVDALEMFAKRRNRNEKETSGTGIIVSHERSNFFEFHGKGYEALETVVSVLNMPHHRAILTRQYRPKGE